MCNEIYGYIRVSTKEQNESRQLLALKNHGVSPENIYSDRQSGKDFERPGYKRLIDKIQPGDTIVIKNIDRLGRYYNEILEQWRIITRELLYDFAVLDMPLLDTHQSRDLIGTLISDIVLQLLSYVAETEREFIRRRQREGIEAARERRASRTSRNDPSGQLRKGQARLVARHDLGERSRATARCVAHDLSQLGRYKATRSQYIKNTRLLSKKLHLCCHTQTAFHNSFARDPAYHNDSTFDLACQAAELTTKV